MRNRKVRVAEIRHLSREFIREHGLVSGDSPTGLPTSLCHILIELESHGSLNQMQLAQILKIDKSSISRNIKKMADEKWIVVSPDPEDPRYNMVSLTAVGKKMVGKVNRMANEEVIETFLPLSDEEEEHIISGMMTHVKALKRKRALREYHIRPIQQKDNLEIMAIIKKVLKEFGADRPGFAFVDPELEDMQKAFSGNRSMYFIVERRSDKKVVGGAGLGPLAGGDKYMCELKKMYFLTEVRGLGLGKILFEYLLSEAQKKGYEQCYLETLKSMEAANHLYYKYGFKPLAKPMGNTGHFGCDAWYIKKI